MKHEMYILFKGLASIVANDLTWCLKGEWLFPRQMQAVTILLIRIWWIYISAFSLEKKS